MFGWLKAAVNRLTFSRHRSLSLIADWLANALWLIEANFLSLAKKAYGGNAVVYACVKLLANSISEAPLKSYTEDPDGTRTELDRQHPLNLLIKRPNELMTEYEMWELTTIHISVAGHAFWWKQRAQGGQIIALWPLRPDRVGPIYSDSEKPGEQVLAGWSYQDPGSGQYVPLARRDVMAFNFPDPADESGGIVEGLGPLQVLAAEVSADNEATAFVGALLKNYATPSLLLKLKSPVRDEDEASLIKSKAAAEFGGSNRGKVGLLDGEADVQMTGFSLQQLEFPDLRDVAESRIAAVIGVPPILVGLKVGLKSASIRANFGEARQYFAETTVTNYWRRYQDQFSNDVAAEFGDNIVCIFDTAGVRALAGQRIERIKPVKDGFTDGAVTVNEYRAELGLPALAGGDVRRVPTNVVEVPVEVEEEAAKSMGLRYLGRGRAVRALDYQGVAEQDVTDVLKAAMADAGSSVAKKIKAGEIITDDEITAMFADALRPALAKVAMDELLRMGGEMSIPFDPAEISRMAADWAKDYTYSLVKDISAKTRNVIADAVTAYLDNPQMTLAEVRSLIEPAFGVVRAQMIATTETTRALANGVSMYSDALAKRYGIPTDQVWYTQADEKVCFPAETMVQTEQGPRRIDDLTVGDSVLTRQGYRRISATSIRPFDGSFVTIQAGDGVVTSTDNHPFWVEKNGWSGWLPARLIRRGDVLRQMHPHYVSHIAVNQFVLGDADDLQAMRGQKAGLSSISLGIPVPVVSIHLDGQPVTRDKEVNGVTPEAGLLLEGQADVGKGLAYLGFDNRLGRRAPIASETTELAVSVAGHGVEVLSAGRAGQRSWWSAAFLRAVMAVETLLSYERLAATLTGLILGVRYPALVAANGIAVGYRSIDGELLVADRAHLGHLRRMRQPAVLGTEPLPTHNSCRDQVEDLAAPSARNVFAMAHTLSRFVLHAFGVDGHSAQPLINMHTLYHGTCASTRAVYNLEVDGDHTFYANGFLVHNCSICGPLDGMDSSTWGDQAGGPPAHPRCRCRVVLRGRRVSRKAGDNGRVQHQPTGVR